MADEREEKTGEEPQNLPPKRARGRPRMTDEQRAESLRRRGERRRLAAAESASRASAAAREIGPLPDCVDPARRARCRESLLEFLSTYFPGVFRIQPFSPAHLDVIAKMERCIREGALVAMALPRGFGKSSLCERAALYAILYGFRRFVVVIGANVDAANDMLASARVELEENDLLLEDFPEVCYPLRRIGGIPIRCNGQLLNGERTRCRIASDCLSLPVVRGSASSGAIVKAFGITGRIRGAKETTQDANGKIIVARPDLAILDDIATDQTSNSPTGNRKILDTVAGAVLGLAGAKRIAAFLTATVIAPDDAPDQLLNHDFHAEWQGERHGILKEMPNEKALEKWKTDYKEIWKKSQTERGDLSLATQYYLSHQAELDAGAVAAWPELVNEGEASAIQHAMNLMMRDERSFWAEYMNQPMKEQQAEAGNITPDHVLEKIDGSKQFDVPHFADHLILSIDVQGVFLPYVLLAVASDMTAHVVAYGAYPQQAKPYYTVATANPTLQSQFPGQTLEAQIYAGLDELVGAMCGRVFRRAEDGAEMGVDLVLIDSAWGISTRTVYDFCRNGRYHSLCLPTKGAGVGPNNRPFNEYRRDAGTKPGDGWLLKTVYGGGGRRRYLLIDTNQAKTFFRARLMSPLGTLGTLTVCGVPRLADSELIVESFTSEVSQRLVGNREIDAWRPLPKRQNHLFDCACTALVGASYLGCSLDGGTAMVPESRQPSANVARKKKDEYAPKYAPRPERVQNPARIALSGAIRVKR